MSEDPERTTASKMVEALQAELKETVASLQAERKAKEEAVASLRAKDEAVTKLEAVVAEINGDANLQAVRRVLDSSAATTEPLDHNNPGVTVLDNNVRSENTTISRFSVDIHEEPQAFLKALLGDHPKVVAKRLFQKVLEEGVLYWSFMAGNNKSCDLLLRLCVERQDEEEIFIRVTAVEEEELYSSLPNAHSTAAKNLRLLLKEGTIVLQPLPFGQTSFTFMAQVDVGDLSSVSVSSAASKDPAVKKIGARGGDAAKGHELFYKLATMFYDRFKKEDVIDEKRKADFVKNKILNAPPLTVGEQKLIKDSVNLVEELASRAKRIAGTVNDSVEKFLHHAEGGGGAVGMTVAKIDVAAVYLFTELWLIDTYARKAEAKNRIRRVWNDLDGTRGLQHTNSVSLPGGFQDRLFESWLTWERRVEADGHQTFVIGWCPLEKYRGTHHRVDGAEKMHKATTRGVYIIKEVTENTCEWTKVLQADLKISLPGRVMDIAARQHLGGANETQEKFRRNRKEVDRERGAALAEVMIGRRGVALMEDQVEVFERCVKMAGDVVGVGEEEDWKMSLLGWKVLNSPCLDVKMWMKYNPPQKGERSVGTGKAVGVVDCSAEEVAAWAMNYCSNERMRKHSEEGQPARLELRELRRENEGTFATVKRTPVFLDDREFVYRMIWSAEIGKVMIAFEPVGEKVDYGVRLRTTKGLTKGLWIFEDIPAVRGGAKQCRATYVMNLDARGFIPTWVVNKTAPKALKIVQEAIDEFRQDDRIDAAEREEFTTFVKEHWKEEVYSVEELLLINKGKANVKAIMDSADLKVVDSGDPTVSLRVAHLEDDKLGTGAFECVIDAEMEELVAFDCLKMSREAKRNYEMKGGIERLVKKVNGHSFYVLSRRDLKVPGFTHREFRNIVIWRKESEDKMIVCYDDTDDLDDEHPRDPNAVTGSARVVWVYERLPALEGVPQTRVQVLARIDVAGSVPHFVMNRLAKNFGKVLINMTKKFDKSLEIDAGHRAAIAEAIELKEESGGAEALAQFEALVEERPGWERPSRKSFGLADSMVKADKSGHAWGTTRLDIRASMEEVAAFLWDFGSRSNMEISGDLERSLKGEIKDTDKKVVRRRQKLESGDRDRNFLSELTLQKVDKDTIIVLLNPLGLGRSDENSQAKMTVKARGSIAERCSVEARETVGIRLKRLGEGLTKLEYVCECKLGFDISLGAGKAFVEGRLDEMAGVSIYFQRLLPLGEYGVGDGKALAHDLLWKASSSKTRIKRFEEVLLKSRALQELKRSLPWIDKMMVPALEGHLHLNKSVHTKLECVSVKEAIRIGKNLISSLKSKKLAAAGVDAWRIQNKAVKELMEKHEWFLTMIVELSKGIVKSAAWGLMFRVTAGAVLSVTDLATDLVVLKQFWDGGEEALAFRNASLASLSASIGLQLVMVLLQNRKKGLRRMLNECLIVVTGFKAPWDAYKVSIGAEQEIDTVGDPMLELTTNKCIELFAESIPGIIIQLSAIVRTINVGEKEVTMTAYLSLLVSLLTTGFISATMSYDYDTDPKKRAFNPEFYGYVPDDGGKRALLFFTLILQSAVQVLIKALVVVILGTIESWYPLYYILGDISLFLLYKIVTRDFRYWIRIDGIPGLCLSLLNRTIVKLVADFAAIVQFRHPYEVGGLYFLVNMCLPVLWLTILLALDLANENLSEGTLKLLTSLGICLGISLIVLLGAFYLLINKEYRHTFYSSLTGPQMTRRNFLEGTDVVKADALTVHKSFWSPIKDEVAGWLNDNWTTWVDEKPDWFTDQWKSMVPEDMIPRKRFKDEDSEEQADEDEETKAVSARQQVRRKSLLEQAITGDFDIRKDAKVAPGGRMKTEIIDEEVFIREIKRNRSLKFA